MSIKSSFPTDSPSLVLDFANSRKLDPRVSFDRASTGNTASYMGPDGYIKYAGPDAPRFDHKQTFRTNLVTYSEQFDQWNSLGPAQIIANQGVSPDGTTTADRYSYNTGSGVSYLTDSINVPGYTTYSFSLWVKDIDMVSNGLQIRVREGSGVTHNVRLAYNFSTNIISENEGGAFSFINSSVEEYPNGWKRLIGSFSIDIGLLPSYTSLRFEVYYWSFSTVDQDYGSFYVWGAQLEPSDSVTDYIATNAAAVTRTDTESLGLLVEEQRANLFKYSEDYTQPEWFKGRVIITANATTSPDGTQTADLLTENNTSTGEHYIGQVGFDYTSGQSYTWSWYVKPNGRTNVYCKVYTTFATTQAILNLDTGSVYHATTEQFDNTTYEKLSNGWYRVSFTKTASSTGQGNVLVGFANSSTTYSYLGDGTSGMYYWGAQVEQGSFPTSYIPTSGGSVTRNADDVRILNEDFQSFYNQSEGTFIVESELIDNLRVATSTFNRFFQVSNSSISVGIACYLDPTDDNAYVRKRIDDSSGNAVVVTNYLIDQSPPPNYTHFSISYSDKNYAFCGNGEDVSKDYTTTTHRTDNTTLSIGRQPNNLLAMLNGTMKKLVYYPLQLSNAQLQTLTK